MRLPAALLPAFIIVPALAQSAELGLAESRNGLWCLATGAEKVAPGTELLLYEPYQGIRASARVAQDAGESCGELKSRFFWPRRPDVVGFRAR